MPTIPYLLHFVWIDFRDESNMNPSIPDKYIRNIERCTTINHGFDVKVWNGHMCRNLIVQEYPWFLATYDGYRYPIMRCDAIRYFILYHYGGVYLDIDTVCIRSMSTLVDSDKYETMLANQGTSSYMLTNLFMASSHLGPFMLSCLDAFRKTHMQTGIQFLDVMNTTGPMFLTLQYQKYKPKSNILVLGHEVNPCNACGSCTHLDDAYNIHYFDRSWNNTSTSLLRLVYCNVMYLIVLVMICGAAIWYTNMY